MCDTGSEDLFQDELQSLQYENWNFDDVKAFLKEQKIGDDSVDKIYTAFQGRHVVFCSV